MLVYDEAAHANDAVMNEPSTPNILIVDDSVDIREALSSYLSQNSCLTSAAASAEIARKMLKQRSFDLIILDIMMPGEDGLSLCRWIQNDVRTPILFLSARAQEIDRILGFEMGGDDYVTKPFSPRELLSRIHAILRRVNTPPPGTPISNAAIVHFDRWQFNGARRELTRDDGLVISLSSTEHKLLAAFLERPKAILSRDHLLDRVKGHDSGTVYDRSIDTQVSRLRRKLEKNAGTPELIKTCWGAGYMLTVDARRS